MRAALLVLLGGCGFSINAGGTGGPADGAPDQAQADQAIDPPDAAPDAPRCVGYTDAFGGSHYRTATEQTKLDFDAASAECQSDGGRLAVIETQAEHDHLALLVRGFSDWSWIGLTDRVTEGARVWVTGVPLAMSDFQVFNGEIDDPAADCYNMSPTMIGSDSARWGNYVCTAPKGWICECR